MSDKQALMPEYMRQFQCIGAKCEDTCCAMWTVGIDHETFKKYQGVDHPTLSERLKADVVVRDANERNKNHYASMRLDSRTGSCCFHEGGLCSIQRELGESYLSRTCTTYPRTVNEINGQQEVSLTLSCPEAARLVLLNPQGIEFSYEDPLTSNLLWNARIDTKKPTVPPITKHFWDLRVISIEILQNRRFSLPHRFMQLAVLADRIDERIKQGGYPAIPELLKQFREEIEQNQGVADAGIFPTHHHFQVRFLNDLLLTIIEKKLGINIRFKECLDQYLQGMQKAESEKNADIIAFYETIYDRHYKTFMDEHEYIMENYLVNYVYSSLFPLAKSQTMFENVLYIGILYSLIRMQLIGMSAFHGGLNTELVVKLIQSFVKNFEHGSTFKQVIQEKYRKEQASTLGALSVLVMN